MGSVSSAGQQTEKIGRSDARTQEREPNGRLQQRARTAARSSAHCAAAASFSLSAAAHSWRASESCSRSASASACAISAAARAASSSSEACWAPPVDPRPVEAHSAAVATQLAATVASAAAASAWESLCRRGHRKRRGSVSHPLQSRVWRSEGVSRHTSSLRSAWCDDRPRCNVRLGGSPGEASQSRAGGRTPAIGPASAQRRSARPAGKQIGG